MNILIIAAHPDDEVLGMGGTIRKLFQNNNKIHLTVMSEGASAQYIDKKMIKIRQDSCRKSGKVLGISSFSFFDFPDAKLDSIPQLEINKELEKIISKFKPKIVYTTPSNDISKDHLTTHECTLVATRPHASNVKQVLSYEVPGPVKTTFTPNVYENISKEFSYKINAFKKNKSEIEKFPHYRSIEALEMLSKKRGIEAGFSKAEAFQLISWYKDK